MELFISQPLIGLIVFSAVASLAFKTYINPFVCAFLTVGLPLLFNLFKYFIFVSSNLPHSLLITPASVLTILIQFIAAVFIFYKLDQDSDSITVSTVMTLGIGGLVLCILIPTLVPALIR